MWSTNASPLETVPPSTVKTYCFFQTVGLHTNALGRYERGEAIPSVEVASKIAQALDVSLDYLVGLTNVELNPVTLQRIEEISSLTEEDREHVFKVLDALIRDAKGKK